jgi:branched-chain amino acid transport system substrate-binding protein
VPRFRSAIAPALALVVATSIAACAGQTPMPTPTPSPTYEVTGDGILRIGSLFPTSGTFSYIGAGQVAGVETAVREINEAGGVGGVPVEVFHRNSGDVTTQTAEASYADLLTKGADVVIGPSSSVLTERLLAPVIAASVPLVSPAATLPLVTGLDDSGLVFRTIGSYDDQGAVLAEAMAAAGVTDVAYVYLKGDLGTSLLESLTAAVEGSDLTLAFEGSFAAKTTDFASLVAKVVKARPDAVVIATPSDAQAETAALVTALSAAKLGGAKLWFTSQNLADYSQTFPAGLLDKANGLLEGAQPDAAFIARLKQADPGLSTFRYAEEAYDATIMAALAATIARDDGGAAIARLLPTVSTGGIKCTSFGECLDVLRTETDIDYDGISGPVNFTAAGDVTSASWGLYTYSAANTYTLVRTVVAGNK